MAQALLPYRLLYRAGLVCLLAALAAGTLAGAVAAFPGSFPAVGLIRILRPLHTLFALAWIFFGQSAAVGAYAAKDDGWGRALAWLQIALFGVFLTGALVHSLQGSFSGRAYISWPTSDSFFLLAAFVAHGVVAWRGSSTLAVRSAEAAWLVLLGALLMPAGLAENLWFQGARWSWDLAVSLPVEWQSLDILITGWCVTLYGVGILAIPGNSKPLRKNTLYVIAVIGILLDFGHHNYPSPQAQVIKWLSFSASMLALVSLVRHVRALRSSVAAGEGLGRMLHWVEVWTLFATGGGILMAVPWLNWAVHGTYAVAAHSMGAMIGVNTFLLFVAGYSGLPAGESRVPRAMLAASWALALFVTVMTGLGVAAGFARVGEDYYLWIMRLRPYYALIPVTGGILAACLGWISLDLLRALGAVPIPKTPGKENRPLAQAAASDASV